MDIALDPLESQAELLDRPGLEAIGRRDVEAGYFGIDLAAGKDFGFVVEQGQRLRHPRHIMRISAPPIE
jgi:hypothetical protein